jgi:hypothetical protein
VVLLDDRKQRALVRRLRESATTSCASEII